MENAIVVGALLTCQVMAAPSVKNFGNTTRSTVRSNVRDNKKTSAQSAISTKKTPAIRVLGASAKSTPGATNITKAKSAKLQKAASVNSTRAPGLHGNLIKGISSKLSSNYSTQQSGGNNTGGNNQGGITPGGNNTGGNNTGGTNTGGDSSVLEQRITALETQISTKQDKLESGAGINIDNNTISLSQETTNLIQMVDKINQDIDSLSEQVDNATLPNNYYNIAQTEAYLQQNYYTKQDVDQITDQLSNATVMNSFDTEPSANTTYILKTDANGNGTWKELQVQEDWNSEL